MSDVRNLPGSFSRGDSNDRLTQNSFVCLSDADRVSDEPNAGDALIGSPDDDNWSGLEVDQTLGQLMCETRKHRGLSREQVADQTHIPAYYVRMIESDSYDAIPDQLYLLPFFQRYAIFLGLDAKKVVSRFICDFEKAENEVPATAPKMATAKTHERWRQIATASVLAGILMPCIAWGIATMRATSRHPAENLPTAAISPAAQPSAAILSTDAGPVAEDSAQTPDPVMSSTTGSNAGSQIAQQPRTQTRHLRRWHAHRLNRHSRHWRQRTA